MDPLYSKLKPLVNLPRRERYIETYKILLHSLPKPTHEEMKKHLARYWHTSPKSFENRSAFVAARDFRLFCIWGRVTDDSKYQPFQNCLSSLESLKLNLA